MEEQKSRRLSSVVLGLLIVFSAFTVLNFVSMNVLADEYWTTNGHWVNGTESYEYTNIYIQNGNLTITSTGSLTFHDGVTLTITNSEEEPHKYGIVIEQGGEFIIDSSSGNTTIQTPTGAGKTRTYPFLNSGTLNFTGATVERVYGDPDTAVMGGIVNEPGSVCKLTNCKLFDSDTHSLYADHSDIIISGTETRIGKNATSGSPNTGNGLWIKNSSVSLSNINVSGNQKNGIVVEMPQHDDTVDKFSDGTSCKSISFYGAENHMVNFSIPKNSTIISASINIKGSLRNLDGTEMMSPTHFYYMWATTDNTWTGNVGSVNLITGWNEVNYSQVYNYSITVTQAKSEASCSIVSESPKNIKIDVGNDDTYEWTYSGKFEVNVTVNDMNTTPSFSSELQEYIDSQDPDFQRYVTTPLVINSNSSGTIEVSTISIVYEETNQVSIEGCSIYDNAEAGIRCLDGADVIIGDNSTIKDSGSDGIYISNSTASVKYCSIYDNGGTGINCLANSTPVIQYCNITSNFNGINVSGVCSTGSLIDHNLIQGSKFAGIRCNDTNITISNNNVSSSAQAITFMDLMEAGQSKWNWVNGSLWNLSDGHELVPPSSSPVSHSGAYSWVYNQSAGVDNNTFRNITTEDVDLSDSSGAVIRFWARYEVDDKSEVQSDPRYAVVKSSGTKGSGSKSVQLSTWESTEWTLEEIDISEYDGQSTVNLTLSIDSLNGTLAEGGYQRWFMDDIVVFNRYPGWGGPKPVTARPGNGIECVGNVTSYIYNNNVNLSKLSGIYFDGWNNATVDSNIIQYNEQQGIEFCSANGTTVENNNISYNDNSGSLLSGSDAGKSHDNSLVNNDITFNKGNGIFLCGYDVTNTVEDNNLSINKIYSNNKNGIRFERANNNNLVNNNVLLNNNTGIFLFSNSNGNELDNNHINANKGSGIILASNWWQVGGGYNCTNENIITNNTISSNYYDGVTLYQSGNNTIADNTIAANGGAAIQLLGSEYNIIENNNISSEGEYTYRTFSTDGHYEHYTSSFVPYATSTFNRPEAIYVNYTNCTYMVYMNWSFETYIVEYNHTTDTFSRPVLIGVNPNCYNDHAMPILSIANNGTIYVFYGQRADVSNQSYKISNHSYDISEWSDVKGIPNENNNISIAFSYPQVWNYPPSNQIIYIATDYHPCEVWEVNNVFMTKLLSDGTWSNRVNLTNFTQWSGPGIRPYVMSMMDSRTYTIHLAWIYYGGNGDIFYMKSTDGGSTWSKADNTPISIPANDWDYTARAFTVTGSRCQMPGGDINVDASGNPLITFYDESGDINNPIRIFKLLRWTGAEWVVSNITNCGSDQNQMCIIADSDTHFRAYCACGQDLGGSLNEFISTDSGADWSFNRTIAGGVAALPARVYNATSDKSLEFTFSGGSFAGNVNAWGQNIPQGTSQMSTRPAGILLDASDISHGDGNDPYNKLHSSNYTTIVNNNIVNTSQGIALYHSCFDNTIADNNVSNNSIGVGLYTSADSTITNNTISSNDWGIILNGSSYNNVTDNDITFNSYYGTYLNDTTEYNSIYHNNFIYNCGQFPDTRPQAYDNGNSNSWDDGYPYGGNYWSNYNGSDIYHGPDQNVPGSDGLGDTPYGIDTDSVNSPEDNYPLMRIYTTRGPIRIDSNSDFDSSHGVSGGGTQLDPWVIENYFINGTNYGYCIYIGNTTDYFTIRNCYLYNAGGVNSDPYFKDSGLILNKVTNGTIENNWIIENDQNGIYLHSSNNDTIQDNYVNLNDNYGILSSDSHYITIEGNTINSNDCSGIYLYYSENYNIEDNVITSNGGTGIYLETSTDNTILNNNLSSNDYYGVGLEWDSSNNDIGYNEISYCSYGIMIDPGNYNTIYNNNISSNTYCGIELIDGASYNTIENNIFYSNGDEGVFINSGCDYNEVYHNNFIDNNVGYAQARDDDTTNSWDDGYPSGGNYWSDYSGTDSYGGSGQNLNGNDGIGDTDYNISGGSNVDNYPMMYENRGTYTYWAKTYGNTSTENLYWKGIQQTSDGGYIVAGFTNSDGAGGDDFWVLKLEDDGDITWQKTYGGSSNEEANAIIQTSDGGYIVVGYTFSYGTSGSADMWVIKLNEWGNITWNYTYGGIYTDSANSIVQTSDGGYIVAGYTVSAGSGSADYWVIKLESDGDVSWDRTFGGSSGDYADSIIQTSDGNYTVGGLSYSYRTGASGADYWILHIESDGDIIWNKTYGFSNSDDGLNSIMQTSDGGYIAGGYTYTGGDADYWVLKLESDGDVTWQYRYGGDYDDCAVMIDETSDGGFVVAGYTQSYGFDVGGSYDCWVLKLYSNGTVNWQKTYGGDGNDYAWSVEETSDGGVIVAGYTNSNFSYNGDDCWILKLGPNGGITFDYNSWAYTSNTDATAQSTSCTVSTASTGVKTTSFTPGTTSGKSEDTNCIVGTQATPSYGWYNKD